jgi:hypothetical protein
MVDTYPKIDVAGIENALDKLARIECELTQAEAPRPRASLALISMRAGLVAPFVATVTLAVCDALSAAVLGSGGGQGAIDAAQVTAGQQLQAILWLFVGGETLALAATLLALGLGIIAIRRLRTREDVRSVDRNDQDHRMAWGAMLLGGCELAGWVALAIWLLKAIGPLS